MALATRGCIILSRSRRIRSAAAQRGLQLDFSELCVELLDLLGNPASLERLVRRHPHLDRLVELFTRLGDLCFVGRVPTDRACELHGYLLLVFMMTTKSSLRLRLSRDA